MDSTQDTSNFRDPSRWNSVPVPDRVALRAVTNVEKRSDGCWISRYSVSTHGYAQIGWAIPKQQRRGRAKNMMILAHRAAWVWANGQMPVGITIDHLCKVKTCVNPAHLRAISNSENARRTNGKDWPLGTCRRGHPNSERTPVSRTNRHGERVVGTTCPKCVQISREKWITNNPDYDRNHEILAGGDE